MDSDIEEEIHEYLVSINQDYLENIKDYNWGISYVKEFKQKNKVRLYIEEIKYDLRKVISLGRMMRKELCTNLLEWFSVMIHEYIDQVASLLITNDEYYIK